VRAWRFNHPTGGPPAPVTPEARRRHHQVKERRLRRAALDRFAEHVSQSIVSQASRTCDFRAKMIERLCNRSQLTTGRFAETATFDILTSVADSAHKQGAAEPRRLGAIEPAPFGTKFIEADAATG
jgi:hypothetical protein